MCVSFLNMSMFVMLKRYKTQRFTSLLYQWPSHDVHHHSVHWNNTIWFFVTPYIFNGGAGLAPVVMSMWKMCWLLCVQAATVSTPTWNMNILVYHFLCSPVVVAPVYRRRFCRIQSIAFKTEHTEASWYVVQRRRESDFDGSVFNRPKQCIKIDLLKDHFVLVDCRNIQTTLSNSQF